MAIDKPKEILPWYVSGSLSEEEQQAVEAYIAENEDARREVEFLRAVRQSIKAESVQSPGELGWKRLQRQIALEKKSTTIEKRWWRPAMAAAVLIILIQAGLLWNLGTEPTVYVPADRKPTALAYVPLGEEGKAVAVIQLRFAQNATERQIREVISSVGGSLVGGPGAIGVYRVSIDADPDNKEKIAAAVKQLKARDKIVTYVGEE